MVGKLSLGGFAFHNIPAHSNGVLTSFSPPLFSSSPTLTVRLCPWMKLSVFLYRPPPSMLPVCSPSHRVNTLNSSRLACPFPCLWVISGDSKAFTRSHSHLLLALPLHLLCRVFFSLSILFKFQLFRLPSSSFMSPSSLILFLFPRLFLAYYPSLFQFRLALSVRHANTAVFPKHIEMEIINQEMKI